MNRINKEHLERRVGYLNELLDGRKVYEIGYRNGNCMLDQSSLTHAHCIIKTITAGTKREVNESLSAMIEVLR